MQIPLLMHYRTIVLIEKRIAELKKEIEVCERIMDEPEMLSDVYFAKNDIENFNAEIKELRETIKYLI